MTPHNSDKDLFTGLIFALAAFGWWGLVNPYFFGAIDDPSPLIVVAHRTLWSFVAICLWLKFRGKFMGALDLARSPKVLLVLTLSGALITTNWGVFIYTVQADRLLDVSIGYFMTPLTTASFGIIFLGERPRQFQCLALGFAAVGVALYTMMVGNLPLIALILSLTFTCYSGIRKRFQIPAERGMAVETGLMLFPALIIIAASGWFGLPYLISTSPSGAGLLIAAGVVTLLPLVWYNEAAARLPFISIGLLQFLVPCTIFLISLVPPFNEALDQPKLVMFVFVWIGLGFYVFDLVKSARSSALDR